MPRLLSQEFRSTTEGATVCIALSWNVPDGHPPGISGFGELNAEFASDCDVVKGAARKAVCQPRELVRVLGERLRQRVSIGRHAQQESDGQEGWMRRAASAERDHQPELSRRPSDLNNAADTCSTTASRSSPRA